MIDLPQSTMTNIFIDHNCFVNFKYHQQLPKHWGFGQTACNGFIDWHQRWECLTIYSFSLCQFIPLPLRSNYSLPVHISHMVTHFSRRGPRGRGRGKISRDSIELYSDYLFKCCQSGAINLWFSIIPMLDMLILAWIKGNKNKFEISYVSAGTKVCAGFLLAQGNVWTIQYYIYETNNLGNRGHFLSFRMCLHHHFHFHFLEYKTSAEEYFVTQILKVLTIAILLVLPSRPIFM